MIPNLSGGIPVKAPGTSKFRPATLFFVGPNLFGLLQAGLLPDFGLMSRYSNMDYTGLYPFFLKVKERPFISS